MIQSAARLGLMCAFALAACGPCESEPQAPTSPSLAGETMESNRDAQDVAERRCREAYFEFELTEVEERFDGDWVAFYEHKVAEDRELAANWHWDPSTPLGRRGPEDARARRALELELERVVLQETDSAMQVAAEVVEKILAGDVASVARDCTMYGTTPAGIARCEELLTEQLPAMQRALRSMDPEAEDYGRGVGISSPMPDHGVPATARVRFGPEAPAPEDENPDDPLEPSRHAIELIWSGPVMPDPSGPILGAPQAELPSRGRWRFSRFVFPYSRRMGAGQ